MAGDFSRWSPEPLDFRAMLKKLSQEELVEVLSEGLCHYCQDVIEARVNNLNQKFLQGDSPKRKLNDDDHTASPGRPKQFVSVLSTPISNKQSVFNYSNFEIKLNDEHSKSIISSDLSEDQELIRFGQVGRQKNFVYYDKVEKKEINVLKGLELHTKVFNPDEQKEIVELVYALQRMGRNRELRARTYSEPRKWMRGKGRVTIQFGCCYNYAVDNDGNPPGIVRDEEVDPLPPLFKKMIRRMVRWHVLPPSCVPDSCIVNIYDEVSFLSECKILFGTSLKIVNPGDFSGPFSLPLPLGSVLVLNGNGADVAKHCVPSVPAKRISITFRKMDVNKLPYRYTLDPELSRIKPIVVPPSSYSSKHQHHLKEYGKNDKLEYVAKNENKVFSNEDDFPLGKSTSSHRRSHR